MTTVTDSADAPVERALAAAAADPSRIGEVLTELSRARVWIPLPGTDTVRADGAVSVPTVIFQGADFVPVFTSAARMRYWADRPDRTPPHIVVPAAALARLLPARLGIAINPDVGPSIAVSPDGVADLAHR